MWTLKHVFLLCLDGLSCANLCIVIQFIKCLTQIFYLTLGGFLVLIIRD